MTSRNEPKKTEHSEPIAQAIQEATDKAEAQGFIGVDTDPTPNEHYTVAGVTAGKPTPETDVDLSRKIRADLEERDGRF